MLPAALPEPWWDLTEDGATEIEIRNTYSQELRQECGPSHLLSDREYRAVAKCGACDRALFALDQDEWALVHFTWANPQPGWPTVDAIGPWDGVLAAAVEHAQGH
jgi:hypothetical protein